MSSHEYFEVFVIKVVYFVENDVKLFFYIKHQHMNSKSNPNKIIKTNKCVLKTLSDSYLPRINSTGKEKIDNVAER